MFSQSMLKANQIDQIMMPRKTTVPNKKAVLCRLLESMRVIGWHRRIQLKKRILARNQNIFFSVYTLNCRLQQRKSPNIKIYNIYNNCSGVESPFDKIGNRAIVSSPFPYVPFALVSFTVAETLTNPFLFWGSLVIFVVLGDNPGAICS
jgi:hypothetical protein